MAENGRWRWFPGSSAGQIILIVVLATLAAHVIGAVIWFSARDPTPPEVRVVAGRIITLVRICTALPENECETALAATSAPGLRVSWTTTLPEATGEPGWLATALEENVGFFVAPLPAYLSSTGDLVTVGVKIGDHYARFDVSPRLLRRHAPSTVKRISFLLIATALPVLALTLWAVRQVTRPLANLARTAASIGADGPAQPPLSEQGTAEMRKLARAINGLLERLHRFVTERTRTLAAISHDLRTPLTRLRLRVESVEDEPLRERLLKDIRMMELMIGSSLSLLESQEKREPEESVDLGVLLQTICDEFADAGHDVTYAGPVRCPALCRPRALERALNNVIDNAIKFGGQARVLLAVAPGAFEIDVEDDGPGIPDGLKEDVLKPFYRGRSARGEGGGSGLGLAIAQTIVAGHGGALALLDREPHGLCVRLRLPRRRAAVPEHSRA